MCGIVEMKRSAAVDKAKKNEIYLSKKAGKALFDYKMIDDGDKIAVGVSGGKDSMSLLKILDFRRSFVPIKYDLVAIHIDMYDTKKQAQSLKRYFEDNGYEYKMIKLRLAGSDESRNCFWCSWNRRKALFEEANKLGIKKIALAHHLDDIAESILMNMFYNGEISSMLPKQVLFKGAITLIRPFAYAQESEIVRYAVNLKVPFFKCLCRHADTNKRELMQKIIRLLSKDCHEVRTNIFRSLTRIKKEYLLNP